LGYERITGPKALTVYWSHLVKKKIPATFSGEFLLSRSQNQPAGWEWQTFYFNHCYNVYNMVYLNGVYKLSLGRGGGGSKIRAIWVGEHLGGSVSFLPKSALVMRVGNWATSAFCNPKLTVRRHVIPTLDRMELSKNWHLKCCSIFYIDVIWPLRIFTCLVLSEAL